MQPADIKEPLIARDLKPQHPRLYKIYEYDMDTEPGKRYFILRASSR